MDKVERILDHLFPIGPETGNLEVTSSWDASMAVTPREVEAAARRIGNGKAPGPDGILGGVVIGTIGLMADTWARCLTECLRRGSFPSRWKRARLVLLKKIGKPEDLPSSYRPICLLDEGGKLLERIIVGRLHQHLEDAGHLSPRQFGFRRQRSTIDAIAEVQEAVCEGLETGGVVVAVALDVANAFNSLP